MELIVYLLLYLGIDFPTRAVPCWQEGGGAASDCWRGANMTKGCQGKCCCSTHERFVNLLRYTTNIFQENRGCGQKAKGEIQFCDCKI